MEPSPVKLILEQQITEIMEGRGIQETDIQEVVDTAVNGGIYLHSPDGTRLLVKKRIGNFTVYVEYNSEGEACRVLNVYSHRVSLTEDQI